MERRSIGPVDSSRTQEHPIRLAQARLFSLRQRSQPPEQPAFGQPLPDCGVQSLGSAPIGRPTCIAARRGRDRPEADLQHAVCPARQSRAEMYELPLVHESCLRAVPKRAQGHTRRPWPRWPRRSQKPRTCIQQLEVPRIPEAGLREARSLGPPRARRAVRPSFGVSPNEPRNSWPYSSENGVRRAIAAARCGDQRRGRRLVVGRGSTQERHPGRRAPTGGQRCTAHRILG